MIALVYRSIVVLLPIFFILELFIIILTFKVLLCEMGVHYLAVQQAYMFTQTRTFEGHGNLLAYQAN